MTELYGFTIFYPSWIAIPLVVVLLTAVGYLINLLLRGKLKKLSRNTDSDIDDQLVHYTKKILKPIIALAILSILQKAIYIPEDIDQVINKILLTLFLLTIFYYIWKVVFLFLKKVMLKHHALEGLQSTILKVSKFVFAAIGAIIFLENLGVSLKAVWTTLGVGSVAVALALQDTLSNLLSGLYILADRPIVTGDYVQLDTGQEGFVQNIGWRSTTINMVTDNSVVIPNKKLANAVITNFSKPKESSWIKIPIGVSYNSNPDNIEQIVREVVGEIVDEDPRIVSEQGYKFRFDPGFGDSSLDFTLIVQLKKYSERFDVKTKIRKELFKRFNEEGIEIPFPQTTVHLEDQDGGN